MFQIAFLGMRYQVRLRSIFGTKGKVDVNIVVVRICNLICGLCSVHQDFNLVTRETLHDLYLFHDLGPDRPHDNNASKERGLNTPTLRTCAIKIGISMKMGEGQPLRPLSHPTDWKTLEGGAGPLAVST